MMTIKGDKVSRLTAACEEFRQAAIRAVLQNEVEVFVVLATTEIVNDVIVVGQLA